MMMQRRFMTVFTMLAAMGLLAGCAQGSGKPMPTLTFANMNALSVDAGKIDFVLNTPGNDPKDVSSRFVMSPVEALRRYAAERYVAAGEGRTLRIVVDDARIYQREIKQESKALSWADIGTEDEYELNMVVRVVPVTYGGREEDSMRWKYRRTLVMPQSVSLAEREKRQMEFLEKLIADIDKAMVSGLQDDLQLIR